MFRYKMLSPSIIILTFLFLSNSNLQAQSTDIFTKYSWLENLVNPNDCNGEKITEYDLDAYMFLLISRDSEKLLYFETGQLFCTGSSTFDCVDAYGFTSDKIGLVYECMNSNTNAQSECDAAELQAELYEAFPWLDGLVDFSNCTDETVVVFQRGIHKYIEVSVQAESKIYYEDGTVFCNSAPNFDCAEINGFTDADIKTQYSCGQMSSLCLDGIAISGVYTFDYVDFKPCEFWDTETVDLVDANSNCFIDNGLDRCLVGELVIEADGSFAYGFSISGPGVNGGLNAFGGQGWGKLYESNGVFQNCSPSGDNCVDANLELSQTRVSFDTMIEGCPVRIGEYK